MFLDEFGADTKMRRTHGRAAPGERVVCAVPHGHCKTVSTIAVPSLAGGTTAAKFVGFVGGKPAAVLRRRQELVMDNLAIRNDRRVEELPEAAGCSTMRLPSYSPDYSPISNVKALLRKMAGREVPALYGAIDKVLKTVTPADALCFFKHCGHAMKRRKLF